VTKSPTHIVSDRSPVVSIITPAYNAERFLRETIASVSSQTFDDFEHIIVDDCSRDGTAGIIAGATVDPRIRAHRTERNSGVAAARNAGLELARGSLICFLDADDRWRPQKLERQVAFMGQTGVGFTYMDYLRTDLAGNSLGIVSAPPRVDLNGLLKSNVIGNLTAMATRAAIGTTRFRRIGHEDYVFWLDVLRGLGHARKVPSPEPACLYRVAGNSLSGNKLRAAAWQWNIYRDVAGLDVARSAWYLANYMARGILKRV
jgi:teichuronic acid biosynthesis glycosyltransferase TuaG